MHKNSTTSERRKRLLALLQENPGIRVPQIADRLDVSQGTVRNDLNALASNGQLERVRGGGNPIEEYPGYSAAFAKRYRTRVSAKKRIGRWAAELIEDGDTIALDASSTIYHMASFLRDRANLTVVTDGVEVGRRLAQNPSNTVILLGGVLRPDGSVASDLLSAGFLRDIHIKTAFVSCSGFTPEAGLTERDVRLAELKTGILASAHEIVALIDSSKIGKANLASFARADQVNHLFTDSDVSPEWIAKLQQTCPMLTICAEDSVSDFTPHAQDTRHYRIGFANLGENMPFPVDVRRGLERAAQGAGNIDLVLADNQLSGEVALKVAERFAAQKLDLVIEYQIDEQSGNRIMSAFRQAGIPVIAVDIPIVGATYFGVDHYRAGYMGGVALGRWIQANWQGRPEWLIVLDEPRAGALPAARIQGQLDGLQSVIDPVSPDRKLTLNSGNTSEVSEIAMLEALKKLSTACRIAVICFNDDAAIGALAAVRRLRREQDVVIVGQGADRRVRDELRRPGSRIIGSTAYEPERYGEQLISLALQILRGEPVPPAIYLEHTFIPAAPEPDELGPAKQVPELSATVGGLGVKG